VPFVELPVPYFLVTQCVTRDIKLKGKSGVGHGIFIEPNKEGLIYINDLLGGPRLFSKLTKGGPVELQYMVMGILLSSILMNCLFFPDNII